MDELSKLQAETVTLQDTQVLPLDDPQSWWLVASGSVGLYGVDGGERRFLVSVGAGQALFGLAPRAAEAGRPKLVAVALEHSRLLRFGGDPAVGGALLESLLTPPRALQLTRLREVFQGW